jgi:tetratricopeptide (TPR) repeat protein
LSLALSITPAFRGDPVDSVVPAATASAERALRLDSRLAEPHIALGMVALATWKWEQARSEFEAALAIDPHDTEARTQYGRLFMLRGNPAEALHQLQLAWEDDRVSALVLTQMSYAWFISGQLDSALTWSESALQSNPDALTALIFRAMILVRAGRGSEARRLVGNALPYEPYTLYVLGASGDTATARARLATYESTGYKPGLMESARAYGLLGLRDTAQALTALERATERREVWPILGPTALPMFDEVRASPRFRALVRKVGLASP